MTFWLLIFFFFFFIHILHSRYHPKIIGHILKKRARKSVSIHEIIYLIRVKMLLKMKNWSHRHDINSPRSRHLVNIRIVSVWWCLHVVITNITDEWRDECRRVKTSADEWETSAILSFMNPESPTVFILRKEHINLRSSLAWSTLCYVF